MRFSSKLHFGGALLLLQGCCLPGAFSRGLPLAISEGIQKDFKEDIKQEFLAFAEKDNDPDNLKKSGEVTTYFLKFISPEELELLKKSMEAKETVTFEENQKLISILGAEDVLDGQNRKQRLSATIEGGEKPSPILYCQYGRSGLGREMSSGGDLGKSSISSRMSVMLEEANRKLRSIKKDVSQFDAIVDLEATHNNVNVGKEHDCLKCIQVAKNIRDADGLYHETSDIMLFFNAPSNLAPAWPWLSQAFMKLDSVEKMNLNVLGGEQQIGIGISADLNEVNQKATEEGDGISSVLKQVQFNNERRTALVQG